jgi:ABC-type branched-subunit amino acid transport system substrate-binding protein
VAVLGPNDGKVKLFAPDGFTTQQTIDDAGPASKGMYMSVAGVPASEFKGAAKEFADKFAADYLNGKPIDPYAIYGAQAGKIMFDAIENSDGSRSDVIAKMFATKVTDGLLGSFTFNENGDPQDAEGAVVGFTIYVATDKLETAKVISPNPDVVKAAGAA